MISNSLLSLGILAGVLQFLGYATYFYGVLKQGIKPNPASWLIWSYGNALVCLSYIFLNKELSLATEILPTVCAITCILMSVSFFFLGKFRPLEKFEKRIISLDILVTIFWILSDVVGLRLVSLQVLHIVLLVSTVISFVPLYREVIRDHMAEKPAAWVVWTIAYGLLLLIVTSESVDFESFSYPALYVILHGLVAFLSSRRIRKAFNFSLS